MPKNREVPSTSTPPTSSTPEPFTDLTEGGLIRYSSALTCGIEQRYLAVAASLVHADCYAVALVPVEECPLDLLNRHADGVRNYTMDNPFLKTMALEAKRLLLAECRKVSDFLQAVTPDLGATA